MDPAILFYIGNNGTFRFTFYDEDRNVIVITGGVLSFSVKERDADTTPIITKTTTGVSEGVIVDGAGGVVEFYLLPADTEALRPLKYVYDVQFIDSSSKVYTLVKDVFELALPITT